MKNISVPSSRPLEPRKAAALTKIVSATREWPSQPMLVGAFARDVWFWHAHGIETERATEDIDISMEFPDWRGFNRFSKILHEIGFSQPVPNHPEKLLDAQSGQKIDILPFGALAVDGHAIIWPTDQSRWSILGFEETYRHAALLKLPLSSSPGIRIATLPAMVLLKMVAFYERLQDRKRKDGADIAFILAHYLEAGNKDRLMRAPEANIMDQVEGDLQRAAALLIGKDMGRLAGLDARAEIVAHLKQEIGSASRCPLARELVRRLSDGNFGRARQVLGDLLTGIQTGSLP